MKRVKWQLEEAVALYSLYVEYGFPIPKKDLERLSLALNKRAELLGIDNDSKFRNVSGLDMQSACIEYIATNGEKGLSSASKLFYEVHDMYNNENEKYKNILNEFIEKYGEIDDGSSSGTNMG